MQYEAKEIYEFVKKVYLYISCEVLYEQKQGPHTTVHFLPVKYSFIFVLFKKLHNISK